jgi:hypothetical protein
MTGGSTAPARPARLIAYGIDPTWSLRLSGFRECADGLDGLDEHTHRLRLDVNAAW